MNKKATNPPAGRAGTLIILFYQVLFNFTNGKIL